ncbi:MAG: sodium:solute symporter family transporter [Pseudomonadota bacterium]
MVGFGWLDWTIVALYLAANLAIGLWASRGVRSAAELHLGSRDLPWWALGISVAATYVSALSFLGGPAWAYGDGMAALAIHLNYPLVIFAVVVLFLPFFFNAGVTSIYEYLEKRFGVASRLVNAALFLVSQTITTASILTATAVVLTFATGLDARASIVVITLAVVAYTVIGGLKSVVWTDVFQGLILIAGAGLVLWHAVDAVSPLSDALGTLAREGKLDPIDERLDFSVAPTIWAGLFAMTLFHVTVYGANQMMVQRALAAKNVGDAKKSYLMMGYAAFFIYFLFFFIGALLYVHFEARPFEQPNAIILEFAASLAIPGLMGLLAAAILSASMSSLSSAFNSLSTIAIADFYVRFSRRPKSDAHVLAVSRLLTLVFAVISVPIAFAFIGSGGSILETLSQIGSFFVGAKLAMFGMGFLSKHTNEKGLLVGVAAGFVVLYVAVRGVPGLGLESWGVAWPWYVVIGGGVNVAVGWVASVLLSGFQREWHEQTVPGQIRRFREQGLPEKQDGWYLVPGRVDRACWVLLGFFGLTLAVMAGFATLGGPR